MGFCADDPYHAHVPTQGDEEGAAKELHEVLPKAGLVYSEKGNLSEVLCKPKIMPLKSVTLERLEEMEKNMNEMLAAVNQPE